MAFVATLLTLAYIKAGVTRILDTCVSLIGADGKGEAANYDREPRAFVLTTVEPNGETTWSGDKCGARDTVVRVYAAALTDTKWHVYIGAKWQGGRADRACGGGPVECNSREAAELLLTTTVLELATGKFTGPLSSRLPRVFHGRKLVERPDQHAKGGKAGTVVSKVTDEATAAMVAALKAAEAENAPKPADKAKA